MAGQSSGAELAEKDPDASYVVIPIVSAWTRQMANAIVAAGYGSRPVPPPADGAPDSA